MKRKSSAMKDKQPVEKTAQEQLNALKEATLAIEQSCLYVAIQSIGSKRDNIVKGVNEDDGRAVVDSIEQYLSFYHTIACGEPILTEIIRTLNICKKCSKVLPSFTALRECLEELLTVVAEKGRLEEVINTDYGSVVNDYLQGHSLTMIENVANACAKFEVIHDHVDEMAMLLE